MSCQATTVNGRPCSRRATSKKYCLQHEQIHGLNELKMRIKNKQEIIDHLVKRLVEVPKTDTDAIDEIMKKISEKNQESMNLIQEQIENMSAKIESKIEEESEKTRETVMEQSEWLAMGMSGMFANLQNSIKQINNKLEINNTIENSVLQIDNKIENSIQEINNKIENNHRPSVKTLIFTNTVEKIMEIWKSRRLEVLRRKRLT